jgi:alpha-L-fucosidase
MVYLEAYPGYYAPDIVRSRDLVKWEKSAFNPIMKHSDDDKKIANPKLTDDQRKRIAEAKNINNSDLDFCEFKGKTVIYYSWGNQTGVEHLAEAVFDGSEKDFLTGFFPK